MPNSLRSLFVLLVYLFSIGFAFAENRISENSEPAAPLSSLDMHQFMTWVIDPAADGIWESVGWISDDKGEREISPKTQEEWDAVRNHAATLTEAINLLAVEPRARDKGDWIKSVRNVSLVAQRAMRAAISRDAQAVFEAGSDLENACESCHIKYVYPPEKAELWPARLAATSMPLSLPATQPAK